MSDPKSKLIIDEDWKSQAQAEKEALEAKLHGDEAKTEPAATPAPAGPDAPEHAMPPADLSSLVTMLATQVLVSLGQIANPITNQAEVELPAARHYIDIIEMLETKTAGNRTEAENRLLDGILHELRMIYVQVKQ